MRPRVISLLQPFFSVGILFFGPRLNVLIKFLPILG